MAILDNSYKYPTAIAEHNTNEINKTLDDLSERNYNISDLYIFSHYSTSYLYQITILTFEFDDIITDYTDRYNLSDIVNFNNTLDKVCESTHSLNFYT